MNYGTLKASVASYVHRTDLTTVIPDFIDQARVRIGADLRAQANFTRGTVTSFALGRTALPSNFSKMVAVVLEGRPLLEVTASEVGQYRGGCYAVDGIDLVVPGAGTATAVHLTYYAIPLALVLDADVGLGMLEWPSLWQFAANAEAALYIQDYELVKASNEAYQGVLALANRTGHESRMVAPRMVSDQPMNQSMARL